MITAERNQPTGETAPNVLSRRLTIRDAVANASNLFRGKNIDSHLLDARLIVAHCLGLDPVEIYREPDLAIDPRREPLLSSMVESRASGIPTAYITGTKEFWSLSFTVDERVLIPRPETELLVEESLAAVRSLSDSVSILELGTGSGAVSSALAVELARAQLVSTDISEEALSVAHMNITRLGLADRITLRHGDLFSAVDPDARFDLVVSNPPYLTDEEIHGLSPEVRSEPVLALRGGEDGLSVIERMIAEAADHLDKGGFLIFEIGAGQEDAVRRLLEAADRLTLIRTRTDFAGHTRVVTAQRTH